MNILPRLALLEDTNILAYRMYGELFDPFGDILSEFVGWNYELNARNARANDRATRGNRNRHRSTQDDEEAGSCRERLGAMRAQEATTCGEEARAQRHTVARCKGGAQRRRKMRVCLAFSLQSGHRRIFSTQRRVSILQRILCS